METKLIRFCEECGGHRLFRGQAIQPGAGVLMDAYGHTMVLFRNEVTNVYDGHIDTNGGTR